MSETSFPKITGDIPQAEYIEFFPRRTKYCVLIPVINEGERIRKQLHAMRPLAQICDIIITDGGSTDGSIPADFLRESGVRTLLIKKDSGKLGAQLRIGFAYVLNQGYEGIITIDGNNKDSVTSIPDFVQELDRGFDFVQGSRFIRGGQAINTPLSRYIAIRCLHAPLVSLGSGFHYTDTTNGFRAYSRRYLVHPRVQPLRSVFSTYEILAYLSLQAPRLGLKVEEIPVTRRYPAHGKTPTKIKGWRGNVRILKVLIDVMRGKYDVT